MSNKIITILLNNISSLLKDLSEFYNTEHVAITDNNKNNLKESINDK